MYQGQVSFCECAQAVSIRTAAGFAGVLDQARRPQGAGLGRMYTGTETSTVPKGACSSGKVSSASSCIFHGFSRYAVCFCLGLAASVTCGRGGPHLVLHWLWLLYLACSVFLSFGGSVLLSLFFSLQYHFLNRSQATHGRFPTTVAKES